jgi:thioredoxin reductase
MTRRIEGTGQVMERGKPRLAVLGAGPVGLEAALIARQLGWPVAVYERGRLGEHLERWGFVRLFTPFGHNSTPRGRQVVRTDLPDLNAILTGREHVAAYLAPLARSPELAESVRLETHVVGVGRPGLLKGDAPRRAGPFALLLRDKQGQETFAEADVVFDCTGTFTAPRFLGDGGLPAAGEIAGRPQIACGLEDVLGGQRGKYAGKTVLLVGAGYTAATHAGLLADLAQSHQDTWVIWLARGNRSQPLHRVPHDPYRERDRLAVRANSLATRGEGNIEFLSGAAVERVANRGPDQGFQVTARLNGVRKQWDVDRVISSVGYRPDNSLYRELQISDSPDTEAPKPAEPGFFVLGAKSLGRDSRFLLQDGFAQLRSVFQTLTGKPVAP